jgi:non-specific serine/threonine protein kinase
VQKLVCRGTIEERIDDLLSLKAELAADLLGDREEGVGTLLTELDDDELLQLVRLDLHAARVED